MSTGNTSKTTSSIWTAANIVTCIRIALMPVWLAMTEIAHTGDSHRLDAIGLASVVLFATIMLTDSLDGWLARSRGEVTDFGKVMDPLADKIAVIMGIAWLMGLGIVPSWMLLLVIAREFLVSGLRMLVARDGTIIAASNLGKYKTSVTMFALIALMLADILPTDGAGTAIAVVGTAAMWVAMLLTAWSGIDYLRACWPTLAGDVVDADASEEPAAGEELA